MSTKTFDFLGESLVTVQLSKYPDGNTRLDLRDAEDGMPYATASISMPNVLLCDDEILIKNYSENEGMTDFLVKNNIVSLTHTGMETGAGWLPVARINPEAEWGKEPESDPEPLDYDESTGKYTWQIRDYKISARSYPEAVKMYSLLTEILKDHY